LGEAKACSFSTDLRYLALSGNVVLLYQPRLDHTPVLELPIISKIANFNPIHPTEPISNIAWSPLSTSLFAVALTFKTQRTSHEGGFAYADETQMGYEIQIFNADTHSL